MEAATRIENLQPDVEHTAVENLYLTVKVPYTKQEPRTRLVDDYESYEVNDLYDKPIKRYRSGAWYVVPPEELAYYKTGMQVRELAICFFKKQS